MSAANEQSRQWFENLVKSGQVELPTDQLNWLDEARQQARQAINTLPVPYRKQEEWRYTSIDGLLRQEFQPMNDQFTALHAVDLEDWLLPDMDTYRLVFANGRCVPQLSNTEELPDGVRIGSLRAALTTDPDLLATWFGQTANHQQHMFTALNTALINDGVFVHVAPGVKVDKPIEVLYLSLALEDAVIAHPRNLVVMEAGSQATLVERFVSTGDSVYFNNVLNEIILNESASLIHHRVQDESPRAYHLSSLFLSQQKQSAYRGTALALGGAWARTDYKARFQDEEAVCTLNGLYLAGEKQLTDFHLDIDHAKPHCASEENFRGILYGKGRAVFDGKILVAKDAQKSDAHLHNANLMLTRSAEVDTKPQLEIYADDVKCSHGTTVGQLDPEQVYYMRSRGIETPMAKKMLCLGFADEIIDTIEIEPLRQHVHERLHFTLDQVVTEQLQTDEVAQ
ncbi:MAG: Fe-S cluster assembly protein SufD [Thiohalophilus sp.]|uniref:Fe-S cluster assembly protein SufD n=1 Tax=Thiohalophilus sp. TaxID=3028392 RepID=UPI00287079E0|nr:Fe-S cluster assembly protein SufD [Thiohalophilus sp.]MDR9435926.1 Fe-S cluster assembly protein SufD [Thiohalophilus sp.]